MSGFTSRGRVVAFLVVALALFVCAPIPAYATASETTTEGNDNDGPVYLILSLAEEFEEPELPDCDCDDCECDDCDGGEIYALTNGYSECGEECYECDCYECDCEEVTGSNTYIIEIGTYIASTEIGEARFDPLSILADIELPDGLEFEDLDGYEITIIGAFDTFSPDTVHLVSPDPGDPEDPMPRKVQEAFFLASPELDAMPDFPEATTVEMAQFIFDTAANSDQSEYFLGDQSEDEPPGEGPLTVQAILDNIFITQAVMDAPEDEFAEADGDLYPHDPDEDVDPLFEFALEIDPDDGALTIDVCLTVEIDIKPRSKKNTIWIDHYWGVVPVVLWGSDEFSVSEIEKGTLRLGGVKPLYCRVFIWDFNCDGNKDLLAIWGVRCLVKAGALDKQTTELDLTADLTDGGCIKGTDVVKPKWRKKKKKKKCW